MKNLLKLSIGLTLLGSSLQAADPVLPPQVTKPEILTSVPTSTTTTDKPVWFGFWNIRWFPGYHPIKQTEKTRAAQIKAVSGIIKKWAPAVLLASEIRDLESWKKIHPNYPYLACTDIVRLKTEGAELPKQGIAVMSQLAWENIWVLDFSELPNTPDRPSRGVLGLQFKLPGGQILTCYGLHLKSNRGGIKKTLVRRQRTVNYLEWDWERLELDPKKDPIILLGDFNTSAEDPAFKEDQTLAMLENLGFHHAGEGLPREQRLTIPRNRYSANDFDHIMISSAAKQLLKAEPQVKQEVRTVPAEVSDHSAVFLDISQLFER